MRRPPGRAATVLGALALAGAVLLASSATWVRGRVPDLLGGGPPVPLAVDGSAASGLVPASAVVALAAAVALSTVRGPLARLTAVLLLGAGVAAVVGVVGVLLDPDAALVTAAREAVGTTGAEPEGVRRSPWAVVAVLPAVGLCAAGAWALAVGPRWSSTARFDAEGAGAAPAAASPEPARTPSEPARLWDGLSRGEDPTGRA